MLHWSTCNANLQRRFATHVSRTNLQTCYTFESLSKTCNTLQHCKYREKSFATGRYTKMIFRATSYHCKLALQVEQCNTTLRPGPNAVLHMGSCAVRRLTSFAYENSRHFTPRGVTWVPANIRCQTSSFHSNPAHDLELVILKCNQPSWRTVWDCQAFPLEL